MGFEGLKKQDPPAAEKVREEFKRQFPRAEDEEGKKEKGKEEPEERTRQDIDGSRGEANRVQMSMIYSLP